MELTYHRRGDYLFPNLTMCRETPVTGKYGMLRRTFLKENRPNWYQSMMLTDGSPDERTAGEVPGPGQGERPDGMDGAHEQPDSAGGGDRLDGIGLHLTDETGEQDLSEAEEETASALSLPGLPTVNEQIRRIEERAAARYAGEIAIGKEAGSALSITL